MSDHHGIHLTCLRECETMLALTQELNAQRDVIEEMATIIDWGWSVKQHTGYIELLWPNEEIDPEFIEDLAHDPRILDFCVYSIPAMSDAQLRLLEIL